jgi:hypothetical protein
VALLHHAVGVNTNSDLVKEIEKYAGSKENLCPFYPRQARIQDLIRVVLASLIPGPRLREYTDFFALKALLYFLSSDLKSIILRYRLIVVFAD